MLSALSNASEIDTIPACFPSSSINRTLAALIDPLIRGSLLPLAILMPPSIINLFIASR